MCDYAIVQSNVIYCTVSAHIAFFQQGHTPSVPEWEGPTLSPHFTNIWSACG